MGCSFRLLGRQWQPALSYRVYLLPGGRIVAACCVISRAHPAVRADSGSRPCHFLCASRVTADSGTKLWHFTCASRLECGSWQDAVSFHVHPTLRADSVFFVCAFRFHCGHLLQAVFSPVCIACAARFHGGSWCWLSLSRVHPALRADSGSATQGREDDSSVGTDSGIV